MEVPNQRDERNVCVLVTFSEFINFALLGLNPKLSIIYRFVRMNHGSHDAQILQEYEFLFESARADEVANVTTNQPTVLTVCDCMDKGTSGSFTYRLEITQIDSNSLENLEIVNKSITATVLDEQTENNDIQMRRGPRGPLLFLDRNFSLPKKTTNGQAFVACGRVFNPVLPLRLSVSDPPVVLTQVTVRPEVVKKPCVLVNFSGFLTSILRNADFSNLTFRLVKSRTDGSGRKVLQTWPFLREFVSDTNIKEPIVFNFCDCLDDVKADAEILYTFELIEATLSQQSSYNITQKSMTAQVYTGIDQQKRSNHKEKN
ncbi:DUF4489 domain-containing protein [Pseudalkalibacillus sp. Hm43]